MTRQHQRRAFFDLKPDGREYNRDNRPALFAAQHWAGDITTSRLTMRHVSTYTASQPQHSRRRRCAGPKKVYMWYIGPIVTKRTTLRKYLHLLVLDKATSA
jgi:hypothetical protein